ALSKGRTPRPGAGRPTLVVDLPPPLPPAREAGEKSPGLPPFSFPPPLVAAPPRLTVRLRPVRGRPAGRDSATFPIPDSVPLGARWRAGALAVEDDEQRYPADGKAGLPAALPPAGSDEADEYPWGSQTPDHYYPYRGQPPAGTVRLQPRLPRLHARCSSEVFLAAGRAALVAQLVLQAQAGSPDAVD